MMTNKITKKSHLRRLRPILRSCIQCKLEKQTKKTCEFISSRRCFCPTLRIGAIRWISTTRRRCWTSPTLKTSSVVRGAVTSRPGTRKPSTFTSTRQSTYQLTLSLRTFTICRVLIKVVLPRTLTKKSKSHQGINHCLRRIKLTCIAIWLTKLCPRVLKYQNEFKYRLLLLKVKHQRILH